MSTPLPSSLPGQFPNCYSDYMLSELLASHEDILKELRRKVRGLIGSADFLTTLIGQHEENAAQLGLLLHRSNSA
jgi:hypothetical protein